MKRIAIVGVVALGLLGSAYLGVRVGMSYKLNRLVFELTPSRSFVEALQLEFGLRKFYARGRQDMWVVLAVEPGKSDGYYVDVGSADGVTNSNTYVLDKMGWKGVCIDPFPSNMQKRTCQMFKQPVFNESGKKVQLRQAGENSGIADAMNSYKDPTASANTVEMITATLDEILEKAKAPRHIDYVSIDVEGAELAVLQGLSFGKYEVDAFTIEHNNEPLKREAIGKLLESNRYTRVRSWAMDDWYVRNELAKRYESTVEVGWYPPRAGL